MSEVVQESFEVWFAKEQATRNTALVQAIGSLIAERDRLKAAVPQPAAWLPIETAPKDGTIVAFYVPGKHVPHWCRADDLLANPYWLKGATHWMPLPTPPYSSESASTTATGSGAGST